MRVLWLCNIMLPMVAEKLHVESNVKEGWITGILTRLIAEGKESGITLGVAFPANENLSHFHDVYVFNNTPVECFGFYEDMSRLEQYQPDLERRTKSTSERMSARMASSFLAAQGPTKTTLQPGYFFFMSRAV